MNKTLLCTHEPRQRGGSAVYVLWFFSLLFACTLLAVASTSQANIKFDPAGDPRLFRLLTLMQQRLSLAHDVAMYKWNTKAAIDDPVREQQILDTLAVQAPQYGLAPKLAQDFFSKQIIAGKIIQTALFAEWSDKQQAPFSDPPDLKNKIRPALDQLTTELLTALAAVQPLLQTSEGQQLLELGVAVAPAHADKQLLALAHIKAWQVALSGLSGLSGLGN